MLKIQKLQSWEKEETSGKKNLFGAVPHLVQGMQYLKEIPEKDTANCRVLNFFSFAIL